MPSTLGLVTLVRNKQLTEKERIELINARCNLIGPHLDSFTLPELGKFECLSSEGSRLHELGFDNSVIIGNSGFSLKTQGIFRNAWNARETIPNSGFQPYGQGGGGCADGVRRLWGFTRSGQWVLVTIAYAGEPGYKGRGYERAKTVDIIEVDLQTLFTGVKETPQNIWIELGKEIKSWTDRRRHLYNQALVLAQTVEFEELACKLIPKE
jgi:hypothetical protein